MSINAYVGLPGSGKSYGVVENVILPALQQSRPVFTNIPFNADAIGADYDIELFHVISNDDIESGGQKLWDDFPGGGVIVLDEVWRIWPAGMRANDLPQYQKAFLAEHRHKVGKDGLSQEIIIIIQDLSQIANYVRALVDTTFVASKLDKVGREKNYRIDVYPGPQRGPKYPREPLSTFYGTYKSSIYKYYKSHTKSETLLPGMERRLDKRATIWNNWFIRLGMPVAIVFVIWGVYSAKSFFSGSTLKKTTPAPAPAALPAPATSKPLSAPPSVVPANVQPVQPKTPPPPLPESKTWRVVGMSSSPEAVYVYLSASGRRHRRLPFGSFCKVLDGSITCELAGEIITPWTGQVLIDNLAAIASVDNLQVQVSKTPAVQSPASANPPP